jgi:hypothetical protein
MTEIMPKRRRIRTSKWSSLVTTYGRGYDQVILEGIHNGTVLYSIVLPQQDWFLRTRKLSTSDYAILRMCKFLYYDRLTKTFTIRDRLVIGYLAKKGCKPIVVRDRTTLPSTTMPKV